jgi:hypothetical protein
VGAIVAARLESRPGPLYRPAPSWRQSCAIEILARIPSQEWPSHGPPFLSGKRPRSHGEQQSSYRGRPTPRGRRRETREHKPVGSLEGRSREVGVFLPISRAQRTSEDDGLATTKGPGVEEKAMDHHLREIADCLDEVPRLQSRTKDTA